jgi:hypothetical protein
MGGCEPWSSEMSIWVGPGHGGGGCRPDFRPSSTWPPRRAGASDTLPRRARTTGPPYPSTALGSATGWPGRGVAAHRIGPGGAACAAIGDATAPNAGFAALRCTSGLTVDLEAFQARNKLPSNPYDVVSDGGEGWYVSDGAANNVVHVDRTGKVTIAAYVPDLAASALGGRHGQGVPAGLTLGPDRTLFVALYGGAPFDGPRQRSSP